MRATATAGSYGTKSPANARRIGPVIVCSRLYAIAPRRGPARYPRKDRSGARNRMAKSHQLSASREYKTIAIINTQAPSRRSSTRGVPVTAGAMVSMGVLSASRRRRPDLRGQAGTVGWVERKPKPSRGRTHADRPMTGFAALKPILCWKITLQPLPALEIVMLQLRRFHRITGEPHGEAAFKHEGHRVVELLRLEFGRAGTREGLGVRPVGAHTVVQTGAARQKAFRLGIIDAFKEPHELAHHVAMIPGWPERIFADQPARREDDEIDVGRARNIRRRRQHREDRGVRMIKADRADHHEARQIVFIRDEITVPGDHAERRIRALGGPQIALELRHHDAGPWPLLIGRDRRLEIARIGKAVRAQRAEFRQPEPLAVILADVAAGRAARQLDTKPQPAWDNDDLAIIRVQNAEFGDKARAALLRDNEHVAVRIVEIALRHGGVGGIDVNRQARLVGGAPAAPNGDDTVDKIGRILGDW